MLWIVEIQLICIRLQHRRIAPPPAPVPQSHPVGRIEIHWWAMVEPNCTRDHAIQTRKQKIHGNILAHV